MPGLRTLPAFPSLKGAAFEAGVVVLVCCAIAIPLNFLRSDGIDLIQKTDYEILVPCPETLGEADAVPADSPLLKDPRTLLLDARPEAEHAKWHPQGVRNLPFDYLEPTDPKAVREIASSGAARVVVFGDGQDPDSGEQSAREIAGRGIRNVGFVVGGADALREALAGGGTE